MHSSELDKEQADKIDKYMADKNQGDKKHRGRGVHSRLGPRQGMLDQRPRGPGPSFPMGGPGPLSPRMLMGLIRGSAQMLQGMLPSPMLNIRGPMPGQNLVPGPRGPFPDGMPGPPGGPPRPMGPGGPGDPRGPMQRPMMRGPMRPGMPPGPPGLRMRERGPHPSRMPGGPGPFPGGPPHPGMRMMGPPGPMGPNGPRRPMRPDFMGRGGPRLMGDGVMGPPPIRGLVRQPSPLMPPGMRPMNPNAPPHRPEGPSSGPKDSVRPKGLSVHDRLGPRGAKGKPTPLMGIDATKTLGQKPSPSPAVSEQGQPIPSLVKTASINAQIRPVNIFPRLKLSNFLYT